MRRLPLVAVLLAALAVPAGGEARPTCAADAAKLRKRLPGYTQGLPYTRTGKQVCLDFTGDGRRDIAFTRFDFMTGGPHTWAAYRRSASGWRRVLVSGDCCRVTAESGRTLRVAREGRTIVVSQAVYLDSDPNCCPSGGTEIGRWTWDGRTLVPEPQG